MSIKKTTTGVSGSIDMRAYLQQFLYKWEGISANDPLILPGKSPIKKYLDSLLISKSNIRDHKSDQLSEIYDVKQKIEFKGWLADRGHLFLTNTRTIMFNSFVRQIMLENLVFQIIFNYSRGINEKETIYAFIEDYDLDISFDALKKASFRLRKSKKLPILSVGNVRAK